MKRNMSALLLLAVLVNLAFQVGMTTAAAQAQPTKAADNEIDWQVLSSGGTDARSGNVWIRGTIVQTAIGLSASDNVNARHGFWYAGATCCNNDGMRGDVNYQMSPAGTIVDVSDLTYLVAYIFQGGVAPPCNEEANVDGIMGPAGPVDVADLTYLVAYLFGGGPRPPLCP
ncbi:MAG TPA: hypothetical protein VN285_12000 [Candidatus Deferrimicrobium sp.]|nr:hypothetical protein [Candidatus Deferrimicrobium sp.]